MGYGDSWMGKEWNVIDIVGIPGVQVGNVVNFGNDHVAGKTITVQRQVWATGCQYDQANDRLSGQRSANGQSFVIQRTAVPLPGSKPKLSCELFFQAGARSASGARAEPGGPGGPDPAGARPGSWTAEEGG
jgi:hypothetical protein